MLPSSAELKSTVGASHDQNIVALVKALAHASVARAIAAISGEDADYAHRHLR